MKKLAGIMMMCIVLLLSACSLEPPNWAKPAKKDHLKDMKIGVSISTLNNPFFVTLKNGILKEAKKKGMDVIVVDAQNDSTKQVNNIEDLIQQGVDVLLINPTDSAAISTAVKSANKMGIPVITIDRSADEGNVATFVASDNIKGGKMAANYIIDQVGEKAKVVELEGQPGASATRERGAGFHSIADKKLDIVARQAADFDRSKGLNVMENILQAQKNIQAVFAHNEIESSICGQFFSP